MIERFGDWVVFESLGEGGQGKVFLVRRIPDTYVVKLDAALRSASAIARHRNDPSPSPAEVSLTAQHEFQQFEVGALKVLHSPDKTKNPKTAKRRFQQEVDTLGQLSHRSLIKLLDSNVDENWFVTEYHNRGTLGSNQDKYRGNVLASLLALRPVVEGLAEIHKKGLIHRDIKPDNIFIADDNRLVLGDWGLVFPTEETEERLTDTYENVGSWRWMPPWAQGMRVKDLEPSFDTFMLGKVLWAMISGKTFLPSHLFDEPEFSLMKMFSNDPSMALVNDFLSGCIVDRKGQGLPNAGEMLREVDSVVARLQAQYSLPPAPATSQPDALQDPVVVYVTGSDRTEFSKEALRLLREASKDDNGQVLIVRTHSGTSMQANDHNVIASPKDPREVARYEDAVRLLETTGLLDQTSDRVWRITHRGYEAADQIEKAI